MYFDGQLQPNGFYDSCAAEICEPITIFITASKTVFPNRICELVVIETHHGVQITHHDCSLPFR